MPIFLILFPLLLKRKMYSFRTSHACEGGVPPVIHPQNEKSTFSFHPLPTPMLRVIVQILSSNIHNCFFSSFAVASTGDLYFARRGQGGGWEDFLLPLTRWNHMKRLTISRSSRPFEQGGAGGEGEKGKSLEKLRDPGLPLFSS